MIITPSLAQLPNFSRSVHHENLPRLKNLAIIAQILPSNKTPPQIAQRLSAQRAKNHMSSLGDAHHTAVLYMFICEIPLQCVRPCISCSEL